MSLECSAATLRDWSCGREGEGGREGRGGGDDGLPSSAESGFNHVEPESYEPRLLHIKGIKVSSNTTCYSSDPTMNALGCLLQDNIAIKERKMRRKNLNDGDVYILDLGLTIYQVCCECCSTALTVRSFECAKKLIKTPYYSPYF